MSNHEVVISGIAGTFPECLEVKSLEKALFSDENLVTCDERKWNYVTDMFIPCHTGKIKECFKFDQTFFGIHRRLCNVMDTHAKHSIECTFEAICDAGLNPHELFGSNVAVVMSSMTSETEYGSVMVSKTSGHAMLGHSRCMQANRISYYFNLKGPSFALDSSWVGPMQALTIGHNLVAKGHVRAAIVGASNMIFNPEVSIHYEGLKKLNYDGKTKSYSADADGYSRSEGIVVFLLQRADDALRSYGTVVKVMCSTEMGHRATFPDQYGFRDFLSTFYSSIPVPLKNDEIGYIEGDGSAALKVDAMELNAIADILCPGRQRPLPVGSCKTRLGHAESSAAFMSMVNALIAMKTGYIPSCLNFTSNNPLVPALQDGRLQVVSEKTPLEGDFVGISAFGLSSIYAHALLKRNPYTRGERDSAYFPPDEIPRLYLISGREENVMREILQTVEKETVDENYYALNHHLFKDKFAKHLYRGYAVVGKEATHSDVVPFQTGSEQPIWFIFSGMGSQWNEMGTGLMKIPTIRRSIEKSHQVLVPKGIDLIHLITSTDETVFDNILHAFVGIAAIQIALVDLLEEIGITPDGIVGHSVGELGCSYADKCLTAEQVILAAYARGKASNDAELIKGMMAAVGKGYKDIKDELPEGIEVACHNSKNSCTLSGPVELMEVYVEELKSKGIFAKLVNVANIAYHSKNIAPAAPFLLEYLKEIIPDPKPRSSKWVSSSVPEDQWDTELAKYCSAEYHTNNLLSYVLFEEATAHVPDRAVCIEIAPHGLLQAIVKKSLPSCSHNPLTNRTKNEGCGFFIEALGKLYSNGINMDLTKLYPPVEYPVPRETEYLHPTITWEHSEVWIPLSLQSEVSTRNPFVSWKDVYLFSNEDDVYFISSTHKLCGYVIYPKSNYMKFLMDFASEKIEDKSTIKLYSFQNVKFHMNVILEKKMDPKVQLLHQVGSGSFEILFGEKPVLTGILNTMNQTLPESTIPSDFKNYKGPQVFLNETQIYEFFESCHCSYNGPFRNITCITITERGFIGKVKWMNNAELLFDALFKLISLFYSIQKDTLMDISNIGELLFEPSSLPENNADIDIYYDEYVGRLVGDGIRIAFLKTKVFDDKRISMFDVKSCQFMPYSTLNPNISFLDIFLQTIKENSESSTLEMELVVDDSSHICNMIMDKLLAEPLESLKINPHVRISKDIFIPELILKDFGGTYVIISHNKLPNIVKELLKTEIPLYIIHAGNAEVKSDFKDLVPIYNQCLQGLNVVLYKKRKSSLRDFKFVQLSNNSVDEVKALTQKNANSTNVLVSTYSKLMDTANVYEELSNNLSINVRYFFLDNSSPPFDPSHKFYDEQLRKDLLINVAYNGQWGSLRKIKVSTSPVSLESVSHDEKSFNISSRNVNLKVVGLNLQNLVTPSKYRKFGVIEYSGMLGTDEVIGLAKLTDDNYLEVDPILCWKKPAYWSSEQAATIPLFYTIAYHLLSMKSKDSNRPYESVLIHYGHTPFSQAVISVALSMNIEVYTTCFSEAQRKFISEKFPQIDEDKIYNIKTMNKFVFIDHILESTEGDGVKVVIDALEDSNLRNLSLQCTGNMGRYFFVCNNDVEGNETFGMSIFMKEIGAIGYNPELIFDLDDAAKHKLVGLVQTGISTRTVRPLEHYTIKETCTRLKATDTIIENTHLIDYPKKVLLEVDRTSTTQSSITTRNIDKKKTYLIIGSHNSMWFDIMKWLISRGANTIHIILNQEDVPEFIKKRYNNYMLNHKYITVTFNGAENISTAQNCNEFIKKFHNGSTLDAVFYVKPRFEKQMTNVDFALRTHSKSSYLVSIGMQPCRVTERRKVDGFKGVSFILMKNSLRNALVVSVLDNWLTKWEEQHDVILVDKERFTEDVINTFSDILPTSANELLELSTDVSEIPTFKETSTHCPPMNLIREIDPVFIFPGLKLERMKNFTSKLLYPAYLAKYPAIITSIDDVASHFTKILIESFKMRMFTLVAEGWSGPLALTIASKLEALGKISEVILLDGAPNTINNWANFITTSKSIIGKYLPSTRENEKVSISFVKNWSNQLSKCISNEEKGKYTVNEVTEALQTLINRLESIKNFPTEKFTLKSIVHLFTPDTKSKDISDINELCEKPCRHHILPGVSAKSFLDCEALINGVSNLVLLEYRRTAKQQNIEDIATLDLILDAKFNTEGLSRH